MLTTERAQESSVCRDKSATSGGNEPAGGSIIADRYQIDRLIARGGMAAVYLAHHIKLNRPVALKVLSPPPDAEDAAAFEERFRLEAETLAALDHTHIVILHDFGELDNGRFFLALEYVDGPRLTDVLRDGPMDCERALGLIAQVTSALRYAHKQGVVHRDLKPSNLLIKTRDDGTEHIKVVDFGLVKLTQEDQNITRAGLILGSPHCMSPEQVKGLEVDHRSDIYAIGVLIYRVLTGQYPFHGPNSAATMIAHLNEPVPSFFAVANELEVPDGVEDIVHRCLQKNPSDRYGDCDELLLDIAAVMAVPPDFMRSATQPSSIIRESAPPATEPAPKRRSALWLVVVALALVALLFMVAVGSAALTRVLTTPAGQPASRVAPATRDIPTIRVEPADEEPAPQPVVPEPEPVTAPAPPLAQPAPAPAPRPVTKPRPPPAPAPAPPPVPAPAPAPQPAPAPADAPEGYMGLPDDLQ